MRAVRRFLPRKHRPFIVRTPPVAILNKKRGRLRRVGMELLTNHQRKRKRICQLVVLFALISWIGWCIETLYMLVCWQDLTDRGFLTAPLCTIYGCSILAIYLLIGTPREGRLRPLFQKAEKLPAGARICADAGLYFVYFLAAALVPTLAEFFTALFFDQVFGVVLWDYSHHALNLFGYVSLGMSLLWGALITVAMGIAWPVLDGLVSRISFRTAKKIAAAVAAVILADFLFNFAYLLVKKHRLVLF